MKRVRSESSDGSYPVASKFSKLKSKLFSILGRSDNLHIEKVTSLNNIKPNENRESTPLDVSFQNKSQGPITARQLQDYYKSLQLENSMLSENLNNSVEKSKTDNTSGQWKNAESTNIDMENDLKDNENNEIILIDEEDERDSDNIDLDIELPEALEMSPYFHQPDPLERANLVQLKKMMELEKYRRYRLSYLKEHTRHLSSNNGKSVKKNKIAKTPKLPKLKDIPANRKNTAGTFSISLLDTVPDELEKEEIKPIDDNLVKKLKFTDTKSEAANFDLSNKPRSFKPEPVQEKSIPAPEPSQSIESAPITTKIKVSLDTANVSIDDKPSIGFSFGQGNGSDVSKKPVILEAIEDKEYKKPNIPSFSVPSTAFSTSTEKESEATAATATATSKAPSLFGMKTEEGGKQKPTFSFGAPISEDSIAVPKLDYGLGASKTQNQKEVNEPSKPTFSFGAPVSKDSLSIPKFSFGKSTDAEKKSETTPAFSFGKDSKTGNGKRSLEDANEKDEKPKSSFSFGAPAKTDLSTASKAFSFGGSNKKEEKIESSKPFNFGLNSTPAAGAYSFGAASESKTAEPAKISFNNASTEKSTEKSTFSFGGSKTEETKPGSSFGVSASTVLSTTKSDNAFSFGQPAEKKGETKIESAKSTFNFNNAPIADANKNKVATTSTFSFGANTTVPSMNFGSTGSTPIPETKPSKSDFSFNGKQESKTTDGPQEKKTKAETTFNFTGGVGSKFPAFGATSSTVTTPGASISPAPGQAGAGSTGFSFGTTNKETTPSAVFGNANPSISVSKPAPTGFSFGTGNVGNAFSHPVKSANTPPPSGFNATPAANLNQSTAGNMFSFSSSAFPTLDQAKEKAMAMNPSGSTFGANNNNSATSSTGAFGGAFGTSNNSFGTNNETMNTRFGANSTTSGFGANNNNNIGFGGTVANINAGFGGNNMNAGFVGANNSMNNTINNGFINSNSNTSGFNFGGSGPSSTANSRASTPNFNFTGAQGQNVDPSVIFRAGGGTNDGQNQIPGRRKIAYPRRRR